MYAYVDETGNTGDNIFDEAQPYFLTGALVTKTNFDAIYSNSLSKIASTIGVSALHANELGISKLSQIAGDLTRQLKKSDARFVLSSVEKRYLAVTKIVDYIFDSGENLAVPWQTYNLRTMRLLLVFRLATIIDVVLAKAFWSCLMERNESVAYDKYSAACKELRSRTHRLTDRRFREIVEDALDWIIQHPKEMSIRSATKKSRYGHLPNMVAFINLMDGLEKCSLKWARPAKLIVHDEQVQFEASLKEWHGLYSNASPEPIHHAGETRVLRKVFGSEFRMSRDNDSAGIQVIDVLLWVFKRNIDEKELSPEIYGLLRYAGARTMINDLSFKFVGRQLEDKLDEIFSADISDEKMARAHEMIAQERAARQVRLAEFEQQKLPPPPEAL